MAFSPRWGARIAEARRAHNLTQAALAERISVNVMRVSKWERGVAIPKDIYRVRMAEVFGTTVAELFPYPANGDEEAA